MKKVLLKRKLGELEQNLYVMKKAFLPMLLISENLCFQDADFGYQKVGLTHHLSLPSSSSRMATMEKLYQTQRVVPCKIRAKRGFATHPRSIAERVKVSFDSTVTLGSHQNLDHMVA